MGKSPSFEMCLKRVCYFIPLNIYTFLNYTIAKYVLCNIWMQTFDPILLLLIMDNSTFLYHVYASSITQIIFRSNYRIIFHNSFTASE